MYPGLIPSCASIPPTIGPMDAIVRAAIARWPNVPDIFGWLSLTITGQWRLHPKGDALTPDTAGSYPHGESISNTQILGFINRNYGHADSGRWFFQNGPQRVFVRLDAAPLVLSTRADGSGLMTHTNQQVTSISHWWFDDLGHLYAETDLGPGLIAGRDLMQVLDKLTCINGRSIDFEALWSAPEQQITNVIDPFQGDNHSGIPLKTCHTSDIERVLGFVRNPALGYA